jgi:hypothetical protein
MLAALESTPGATRRIAVLGEMLELGDASFDLHRDCGRAAALAGVDELVVIGGPAADGLSAGAIEAGLDLRHVHRFASSEGAAEAVTHMVRAGDLVLVKGSRGTQVDLVVDRLKGRRRAVFPLMQPAIRSLRLVGYLTFRTAIASLTALGLSLLLGPWLIRRLRRFQVGQVVRSDVPAASAEGSTPTMGGLLILAAVLIQLSSGPI